MASQSRSSRLSYQNVSPWTLPLFYVPALGAQRWFLLYQEQRRLAEDLKGANEQLRAANLSFARGPHRDA